MHDSHCPGVPRRDAEMGRLAPPAALVKTGHMPLSRHQYVSGIVAEMRACHGGEAHAVIAKQAAAFRRSGNSDLATLWDEAARLISWQEIRFSRLAELGYVPEEPTRPTAM